MPPTLTTAANTLARRIANSQTGEDAYDDLLTTFSEAVREAAEAFRTGVAELDEADAESDAVHHRTWNLPQTGCVRRAA